MKTILALTIACTALALLVTSEITRAASANLFSDATAAQTNSNTVPRRKARRRRRRRVTPIVTSTPPPAASATADAPESTPSPTPTVPRAPISGGVLNGKAISKPQPAYPPIARAAHASGTVVVQVLIDETGRVISAHAVSGHPLLQQAAVEAAYQARFSPTKLSGQPVKVTGVIQYNFVAQ